MIAQLPRQDDATRFDSVAPVFAVDLTQHIVSSTAAADAILGRRPHDALCYEVMCALDQRNATRCRADCTEVVAARRGWIPRGSALWDAACIQPRPVTTLVQAREGTSPVIIHILGHAGPASPAPDLEPLAGLTRRQIEILRLLARGATPRAIAVALGVSPVTVRNHIQTAMERLSAHSRLEAVMLASRTGII